MQTVLSQSGIEVYYPCTVHLLHSGENFECNYKSDQTGQDFLIYICKVQNITDHSYWGLKFMKADYLDEQRYWLDLSKLVRSQVRNITPIRFYFRVKVYPPEPYKLAEESIKHSIFQQLRLDLLSGRLFCNANDAAVLVALILQYAHGNFEENLLPTYRIYIKSNVLRKERCSNLFFNVIQKHALEIYQHLLTDYTKLEMEDLILRFASRLNSYGVEPFLVRTINKEDVILCMNYDGFHGYKKHDQVIYLTWQNIFKITHEGKALFVHLDVPLKGVLVFECINNSECNFVWSTAVEHLIYFYGQGTIPKPAPSSLNLKISRFNNSLVPEHKQENRRNISCTSVLVNFNSWILQLSFVLVYIVLFFCVLNLHTSFFEEMSYFKNYVKKFLSKFVFNKMLTF
ncbi:hypothetical protein ABEB36_002451 [Hypothenemus hampei]|uniref:FERM domain-containing protein n=1 Tax=Hypothenemus hampei TaxID=57062 RepID=A0ABD1F679_HYPHA